MTRFEELYNSNPTQEELRYLKDEFEYGSFSTSWEDYYWGVKCITVYDEDDFNPDLLIGMINDAFQYGLSSEVNIQCFIGAKRILADIYSLLKNYEQVVDCLKSIIEVDSNSPAWLFYDYVSAQNKTSEIKENLREPRVFLKNLGHVDKTVSHADKRQASIFKEFLSFAKDYVIKNPKVTVEKDVLRQAAELYGLIDSLEWAEFEKAVCGELVVKNDEDINADISNDSLAVNDLEKKYQELIERLSIMQEDLDEKNQELKNAGDSLKKLKEANYSLEKSIKKFKADIADYENALREKDNEITRLEEHLLSADNESNDKKSLEEEINRARIQKETLLNQIAEMKDALNNSDVKLTSVSIEIEQKNVENEALREELERIKKESQPFSDDLSAEILGRCKTLESLTSKRLAKWLTNNLSGYKNWWENYVIKRISFKQAQVAKNYDRLGQFDLAALLRIMVNENWEILKRHNFLTDSDHDICIAMFDVRNNLSHSQAEPVVKSEVIRDLRIMSDFLCVINANTERKKVMEYIKELSMLEVE